MTSHGGSATVPRRIRRSGNVRPRAAAASGRRLRSAPQPLRASGNVPLSRVTLYTAGHLHTAVPHCSHSRAPIVHTAVHRENNEHGCVYLRCRAVCKLPGCVEGHPCLCRYVASGAGEVRSGNRLILRSV